MVALGVDPTGKKHLLGVREGATENATVVTELLADLVARGPVDEKFPALKETHPEVLARHWAEAGEIEHAIVEWSRAGKAEPWDFCPRLA
jgi:hypothetical protein